MVGTAPFTRAVVLLACNLISSLVFAATDSGNFRQALDAARHDDWETLSRMEKQLGDEHPLQAYLDFHRLRAALPNLNPQRINDYVRDYPDSPLPTDIRQLALVAYGKAERWDDVLAIWQQPPSATSLKCYYYRAKVAQGDTQALQSARDIWAHGRSLPDACDPLFEAAQKQDIIDDTAIWERQQLAFEAGQYSLMRYLDRKLDGRLAQAMMSINAMKGVEIGHGFEQTHMSGSQVHDVIEPFDAAKGRTWKRATNRAGGIEGGMSNGEEIVVRVAVKPI